MLPFTLTSLGWRRSLTRLDGKAVTINMVGGFNSQEALNLPPLPTEQLPTRNAAPIFVRLPDAHVENTLVGEYNEPARDPSGYCLHEIWQGPTVQYAAWWNVIAESGGEYEMYLSYSLRDIDRQLRVSVDDVVTVVSTYLSTTDCWAEQCGTWAPIGKVSLKPGNNKVRMVGVMHGKDYEPIPHIRGVAFLPMRK